VAFTVAKNSKRLTHSTCAVYYRKSGLTLLYLNDTYTCSCFENCSTSTNVTAVLIIRLRYDTIVGSNMIWHKKTYPPSVLCFISPPSDKAGFFVWQLYQRKSHAWRDSRKFKDLNRSTPYTRLPLKAIVKQN
jgi:hypothetical protein